MHIFEQRDLHHLQTGILGQEKSFRLTWCWNDKGWILSKANVYLNVKSWNSNESITAKYMENKGGAAISPCFTPLWTGVGSESHLLTLTQITFIFWRNCLNISTNWGGHPSLPGKINKALGLIGIKDLNRVNKYLIQWYSLLNTLLHKLAGREDHVHSTPSHSKTTLTFWNDTRADSFYRQSVRQGLGEDFSARLEASLCLSSHQPLPFYKEVA